MYEYMNAYDRPSLIDRASDCAWYRKPVSVPTRYRHNSGSGQDRLFLYEQLYTGCLLKVKITRQPDWVSRQSRLMSLKVIWMAGCWNQCQARSWRHTVKQPCAYGSYHAMKLNVQNKLRELATTFYIL